ncbi:MAG TPA: hypothetical protein VL309_10260 [Vicinamibacterales bacterium]|nr:hypothetical protein [Vicinamibacterales bacterium]
MAEEKRSGPDRRRQPRGGRRPDDRPGYTPLVLVIDGEVARRDITETILARLRFAVAPVDSADRAITVMRAILPELIVAPEADLPRLRDAAPVTRDGLPVPIIPFVPERPDQDQLIEAILAALRSAE